MTTTRSLLLAGLSCLLLTVPLSAQVINVTISSPAQGAFAGDTLDVAATVSSTYQLQSVTASVPGRAASLTYSPEQAKWIGTLSLAGLPRGPMTLTVTAQDVFGNSGSAQRTFTHDAKPQFVIHEPLQHSVATPLLRVDIQCVDDDPNGCAGITLFAAEAVVARGTSSIDGYISLDFFASRGSVEFNISARDSSGQQVLQTLTIFIDPSPTLWERARVDGTILDAELNRILYRDPAGTLKIRDISAGTDTSIPAIPGQTARDANGFLTSRGAIFIAAGTSSGDAGVYEWQDGVLLSHGTATVDSLRVDGEYASWTAPAGMSGDELYVRDIVAGVTTNVPFGPNVRPAQNDAGPDGAVAFGGMDDNIRFYENSTFQQLTTTASSSIVFRNPRTDGTSTLYTKVTLGGTPTYAIEHHNGTTATEVAPPRLEPVVPESDYQVENGWLAVTRPGTGGELQVWRLKADGTSTEQVSFFGTSSRVDRLAPDGQLTFGNHANNALMLSVPSSPAQRIASAAATAYRDGATWFARIGRVLFDVVPARAATSTTITTSPNPSRHLAPVTLTATVTPSDATGFVAFRNGPLTIGSAPVIGGMATITTTSLAIGTHPYMTAVYGGDATYASSVSPQIPHTVYAGVHTSVSLTSSPNPSDLGQTTTLVATILNSDATGTVTFMDGTTTLATVPVTSGSASMMTSSLAAGAHSLTAVYSGDETYYGTTSPVHTHTVLIPFGAPPNVVAGATTPTQVVVTWTGVSGAAQYEIHRSNGVSGFVPIGATAGTTFTDNSVAANTTYLYKVRALDGGSNPSAFSVVDPATTVIFTNDPLAGGVTPIRLVHIEELRTAVNAMRAAAGLAPASFTDPTLTAATFIKAVHVEELRDAVDPARAALSLPAMSWTDPVLTNLPAKAVHLQQIRDAVR